MLDSADTLSPSGPRLGVVTVTYNSGEVLQEFLDSLSAQDLRAVSARIYAIDNASTDDSVAVLEAHPVGVSLIVNEDNRGFAAASNQGIRQALADGCEYVLLINNDTVFDSQVLAGLLGVAERNSPGILAPMIETFDPPGVWYAGGTVRRWRGLAARHLTQPPRKGRNSASPVEFATGCCLMAHRSVFVRVGLLDEDFFVYCEDLDFCLRAARAGVPIFHTSDVSIRHKAGSLTGGPGADFVVIQRAMNQVLVIRKNAAGIRKVFALVYHQMWIVGRLLIRRDPLRMLWMRERAYTRGLSLPLSEPPGLPG